MPWQLVYTSAPRGLISGQSGFCTVARSPDLREALAQRLEQISPYHYLEASTAAAHSHEPSLGTGNPVISAYRIVDVRGTKYHVLSRIRPCGLDFTARTNHLAHHLVFQPEELQQLASPAAILRHWDGWLTSWQGDPRLLEALTLEHFAQVPGPAWPAEAWQQLTGEAGRAAGLLEGDYTRGCYLASPPGGEQLLLDLFCETLQLPNWSGKYPARAWQHTFTTFLQGEDVVTDFQWRGCRQNTPAWDQAARRGVVVIPLSTIRVPNNPLAKFAREGPKLPTPPGSAPRAPLGLRKDPNPSAQIPTPRFAHAPQLSRKAKPPAPQPGGVYITINPTLVKGLGIAVLLLVGLLAIKWKWLRPARPGARPASTETVGTTPGVFRTNVGGNSTRAAAPSATRPTGPTAAVPAKTARIDPPLMLENLDDVLPDTPTWLYVDPEFDGAAPLLCRVDPLQTLLDRVDRFVLAANQITMQFSCDHWGLPDRRLMVCDYRDRRLRGKDVAKGQPGPTFTFDCSEAPGVSGTEPLLQVNVTSSRSLKSFSVLFSATETNKQAFQAFRLLVVNETNPPPPLQLRGHFLRGQARTLFEAFQEPLRQRLGQFTNVTWQLKPFVRKDVHTSIYLYADWQPDDRPTDQQALDFAGMTKGILTKLREQETRAMLCAQAISNANASIQDNANPELALGSLLSITNPELKTLPAYTKSLTAEARRSRPSDLYLKYLNKLAEQVRRQHGQEESWSVPIEGDAKAVGQSLNQLPGFWAGYLTRDTKSALTLDGPVANYFLAAWKNLRNAEAKETQEQAKKEAEEKIARLKLRLAQIPVSLSGVAYVSLEVQGLTARAPSKPVELIHFSDFSDTTPP